MSNKELYEILKARTAQWKKDALEGLTGLPDANGALEKLRTAISSVGPEGYMQMQLIERVRELEPEYPELSLLYYIPNGEVKSTAAAAITHAKGVLAGIPDLHLPVARGEYHSLYIELKTPVGRVSKEQKQIHKALEAQGNCVKVCRTIKEAEAVLISYLTKQANQQAAATLSVAQKERKANGYSRPDYFYHGPDCCTQGRRVRPGAEKLLVPDDERDASGNQPHER